MTNEYQMREDSVVVPPGHKVVVFSPTPAPRMQLAACGALIIDYGENGDWRNLHSHLDALLEKGSFSAVIILQDSIAQALEQPGEAIAFFSYWTAAKAAGITAIWVLPLLASGRMNCVQSISSAGFGVHASTADGACFVEVHKPDGSITVGMPGPALT